MKAKTYTGQGYIYFVYEDYNGERFDTYKELVTYGRYPFSIVGYHYSYYYNAEEPIGELELEPYLSPSISQVRDFISRCKQIMNS